MAFGRLDWVDGGGRAMVKEREKEGDGERHESIDLKSTRSQECRCKVYLDVCLMS